jgi:hypothetical protein
MQHGIWGEILGKTGQNGFFNKQALTMRPICSAPRANTLPEILAGVVPAALGDDAPLWGAIALAESLLAA